MAERRPDLAREHRLHDCFRGLPRALPVRFQVSRPADRTSRGWARGVPLAECRFPGPAARRLGLESVKARAPLQTAARRPLVVVVVVVVVVVAATPNYLRQASQNLGKYLSLSVLSLFRLSWPLGPCLSQPLRFGRECALPSPGSPPPLATFRP